MCAVELIGAQTVEALFNNMGNILQADVLQRKVLFPGSLHPEFSLDRRVHGEDRNPQAEPPRAVRGPQGAHHPRSNDQGPDLRGVHLQEQLTCSGL